jgi:MFS family permease
VSFLSVLSPSDADLFSLFSSIIVGDLFSLKQRGSIGAMATAIRAVGAALGGPVGGLLSDLLGWRAAFVGQVRSSLVLTYSELTPFTPFVYRSLSSSTASTRVFTRRAT